MNDDTISRQAAIDTVMKFMPSLTTPDGCGQFDKEIYEAQEMFVDIGQALNDLPSAERWIPVTEKLPAYGEDVLLSMNRDCSIGYLVPTYDERQYEWHHLGCFYDFNEVDAWMPLPTPYKGGEEE